MTKTNTILELSARLPIEDIGEDVSTSGLTCKRYRFDTRVLFGDYTLVHVPMAFACEMSARAALYTMLLKTCD